MGTIKKIELTIPLEQLKNVDAMFFRQIQMEKEKALKKYRLQYNKTREKIYSAVTAHGVAASFKIGRIEQDRIYLDNGEVIQNSMLSNVFKKSEELAACAVTLHDYESLEDAEENFMKTFFYDAWGTALAECGHIWLKEQLKGSLEEKKMYSTCSWSPGQHNVDIQLQKILFRLLEPKTIGITLNDSCMMHPKKSVSSFFGIGPDPDMEQIRACDFCEHRETCPSAYGGEG